MAPPPPPPPETPETDSHLVLRVASKVLIPVILVYGLYVHFHADFGAGGGFQAGVIVAVAVMLYALLYGVEAARQAVPPVAVRIGCAAGVLLYGGVGVLSFFGRCPENPQSVCPYLDYNVLGEGYHGQHVGIILIEIGVLVTVASVVVAVFYAFAGRQPHLDEGKH